MQAYLKSLKKPFPRIAFVYALIAYCAISMLQVVAKLLYDVLNPYNLLLYRASCLMAINFWITTRQGNRFDIPDRKLFMSMVKRLAFSVGGVLPILYCVQYIPVSTNVTLQNTGPIFVFFVEAIHFGKAFDRNKLLLTITCFVGVVFILQPSFLFGTQPFQSDYSSAFILFVCLFSMSAALSMAISFVFIHQQSGRIPTLINLQYSYIARITFSACACNFVDPSIPFQRITLSHIGTFALFILLSFIAQNFLFVANSLEKPSDTMPFGYAGVLVGFMVDIFYFKEEFNWISIVGMLLTSVGLLSKWVTHKEDRNGQKQSQKDKEIDSQAKQEKN